VDQKTNPLQRAVAIVLCAGQGTRVGRQINKILLPIEGEPLFLYAVKTFERCATVDEILLVAAAGEQGHLKELAYLAHCHKVRNVICGGMTRHASEQCALNFLRPRINKGEIDIILIHDGARPLIQVEKVEKLVRKAREVGGAILAVPLQEEEHIVQVDEAQRIQRNFEGDGIAWKAQTPQAFHAPLLLQAYDQAEREQFQGTDTASVLERAGCTIAIVEDSSTNLKVTTAYDLFHAERLLRHYHS
jgi:2-C-methyl-D-erythritol 4-phosphate cytidylyltransferase